MQGTYLELREENDVDMAIDVVRTAALGRGLSDVQCSHLACAVSEVSINAIRYGMGGGMLVRPTPNGLGLEVEVRDTGPGIADVQQAIADGYSTSTDSLGIGLGAAKRAIEYVAIDTTPGVGTRVVLRSYPLLPAGDYELGLVSLPDADYVENGDHYFLHEVEGERLLAGVIDGLGQGRAAHRTALVASHAIADNYAASLPDLIAIVHESIRAKFDDSGVAIGIASIGKRSIEYLGIGDTNLRLFGPNGEESCHCFGKPGLVGSNLRVSGRIESHAIRAEDGLVAVLHTDGVSDRFSGVDLPLNHAAQDIADFVMHHHRREYGDSTVVVLKR